MRRLIRAVLRLARPAPPNPLMTAVLATRPDPSEAECDRYIRAHVKEKR